MDNFVIPRCNLLWNTIIQEHWICIFFLSRIWRFQHESIKFVAKVKNHRTIYLAVYQKEWSRIHIFSHINTLTDLHVLLVWKCFNNVEHEWKTKRNETKDRFFFLRTFQFLGKFAFGTGVNWLFSPYVCL